MFFFQLFQRFGGIGVPQFCSGNFTEKQVFFVTADHGAAALIALQSHELGKKAGREDAGVAPLTVMAAGNDFFRVCAVKIAQRFHAFPPQQRLVGNLIHDGIAILHSLCAQSYRVADAPIGMAVINHIKAEFFGEGGRYCAG